MADTFVEVPTVADPSGETHDGLLSALVSLVHNLGSDTRIGITLIIEGATYSGTLVSGADWFKAVSAMIRNRPTGTLGIELARQFDELSDSYLSEESKTKTVGFVHLLDAGPLDTLDNYGYGLPVRIRLDAVSGWALATWRTPDDGANEAN